MRHRKSFNHLSRTSAHRKAMLANMATSLILYKRINTTVAKAKELRMYVEPLLTKSKEDSTSSRRYVFSYLQSKVAVNELFREISSKIAERPGGYTRILKTGTRLGDNAEMCFIELVDFNQTYKVKEKSGAKDTKATRRGRRTKKSGTELPVEPKKVVDEKPKAVVAEEKPKVEEAKAVVEEIKSDVVEPNVTGETPNENNPE